ncbi:hypothetical protein JGH11_07510 [Dysgonomonas sp. Marseille-P4677]|uniref:hypothetical protein n=1 Tax=Dysgonomonas sp. Marseille-P4677 TaxID=2364790 RepID=UPI00191273E5|nr:hypothetical protein [Dysgonomonas sp. Marseille-P4677]MBK5720716.1 hypothetical protein [Dysgonomonas sp. Marseille-P4677]
MKKRLLLLAGIFIIAISLFSQKTYLVKNNKCREASDSLFQQNIGFDFDKAFKFVFATEDYYIADELLLSANEIIPHSQYNKGGKVLYDFYNLDGQKIGFKNVYKYTTRYSSGYEIYFDSIYSITKPIDFELLKKIYSLYDTKLISEKEAKEIAKTYSQYKSKDTRSNRLYYHAQLDKFIWRIVKQKGFRNIEIEEFEIDAQDKTLISYETYPFYRNLGQALNDKLFGCSDY